MRRAARIDTTARDLTAYAESLGFIVETINGKIDALLAFGQVVTAVDWKSHGGTLTTSQAKLVASGFPVRFISRPEQLDALKAEITK